MHGESPIRAAPKSDRREGDRCRFDRREHRWSRSIQDSERPLSRLSARSIRPARPGTDPRSGPAAGLGKSRTQVSGLAGRRVADRLHGTGLPRFMARTAGPQADGAPRGRPGGPARVGPRPARPVAAALLRGGSPPPPPLPPARPGPPVPSSFPTPRRTAALTPAPARRRLSGRCRPCAASLAARAWSATRRRRGTEAEPGRATPAAASLIRVVVGPDDVTPTCPRRRPSAPSAPAGLVGDGPGPAASATAAPAP